MLIHRIYQFYYYILQECNVSRETAGVMKKELKEFLVRAKKTFEIKELERLGLTPEPEQREMILTYLSMVYKWNEEAALVPEKDEPDLFIKHFCDSLQPLLLFGFKKGASLFDIGAGGGFPSIPTIIFRPDLTVTLTESNRKKINFLKEVVKELALENVEIIGKKSDKLSDDDKKYDYVISRGVGTIQKVSEMGKPFINNDGRIYLFETKNLMDELTEITENKQKTGIGISEIAQYNLSNRGPELNLVALELV